MAKGDTAAGLSSVVAGAEMTIQPGAGVEWIIHNIYHEAEATICVEEGANTLLFDSSSVKGSWSGYFFHLTNTHYITVQNTNAASKLISYDGIVSKE